MRKPECKRDLWHCQTTVAAGFTASSSSAALTPTGQGWSPGPFSLRTLQHTGCIWLQVTEHSGKEEAQGRGGGRVLGRAQSPAAPRALGAPLLFSLSSACLGVGFIQPCWSWLLRACRCSTALRSGTSCWQLAIGPEGDIYTVEISKRYKSAPFSLFFFQLERRDTSTDRLLARSGSLRGGSGATCFLGCVLKTERGRSPDHGTRSAFQPR